MLLVGGGRILVDAQVALKGVSKLIIPEYFSVANAVGAALGTVAGKSEMVESISDIMATLGSKLEDLSEESKQQLARETAIKRGRDRAITEAISKGEILTSLKSPLVLYQFCLTFCIIMRMQNIN